jgi:large subunit ribosomal protein L4
MLHVVEFSKEDFPIFNSNFKEALVHQVLKSYIFNSHQCTKKQKSRSEVSGGNNKPWPQKGRGTARAGSIRSPLFRKGGVIFAATGLRRKLKINKSMYRGAITSLLSKLYESNKVFVIRFVDFTSCKTKDFVNTFSVDRLRTLIVISELNSSSNLLLASRNVRNVRICLAKELNPYLLLSCDTVLIDENALVLLQKYYSL